MIQRKDSCKKPQDSDREEKLITLCGLRTGSANRIGVDAFDENNHPYELKSTTKSGVSTARDVGLAHLEKWRKRNWICAKGFYDSEGTFHFEEIIFSRPQQLERWFSLIEAKLRAKEPLFEKILALMISDGFPEIDLDAVRYVFKRGVLLNDPNIPWSYIKENGTNITADPYNMLRSILAPEQVEEESHFGKPFLSIVRVKRERIPPPSRTDKLSFLESFA